MPTRLPDFATFILFALIAHLFYFPTWNAGFVTDFTGLLWRFDGSSFWDVFNCFGFPALEQFLNLCLYLFYQLFGKQAIAWYVLFTSFHIFNTCLAYKLGTLILRALKIESAERLAFFAALFFLLSPFHTEVVVWKVCLNFLMVSCFMLSSMIQTILWLEGRKRQPYLALLFFFLALFTFELAIMLPIMSAALIVFLPVKPIEGVSRPEAFKKGILPQFLLLGMYFVLNKIVLGEWVGHYGPEVHFNFDWLLMSSNGLAYFFKLLTFSRYWEHGDKEAFLFFLQKPPIAVMGLMLGLGMVLWGLLRQHSRKLKAISLCLGLFGLAIGPVSNLYFYYIQYLENDRYSYLASVFFFLFLSVLLSYLPRRLYHLSALVFICLSAVLLWRTNQHWKSATLVYNGLLDSFEWYDAPEVYLLNLPDNYKGVLLFRDFTEQNLAFADALKYIKDQPYEGKMYDVAQYNMISVNDGVSVTQDSTGLISVTFNQWGNWWWRKGIGMDKTVEKGNYTIANQGHHYEIAFDSLPPNAVLLYQDSLKWKQAVLLD
ncbi:MAG TPA: hypothetical protein PKA00_16245 [Saprospiraceae bacterium]|nr:hypothetical protein [Saprospiraceae bacterium]HMQ84466.1 hypothetical protein [Saprospiraceae bacterium]